MELPGGGDEWLAPSPSPPGPVVPDRHDEHGVGTFIWPPMGTSTWPPMGTFSWPRTGRGQDPTDQRVQRRLLIDSHRGLTVSGQAWRQRAWHWLDTHCGVGLDRRVRAGAR